MSELEQLSATFSLGEVDSYINCEEKVLDYLTMQLNRLKRHQTDILSEMREASKYRFLERVRNLFYFITGSYDDCDYYDYELELLDEHLDLNCQINSYYNKLKGILEQKNYIDIYKLAKFINSNYEINFSSIDEKRKVNYYASLGISYSSSNYHMNTKELEEFFQQEFAKIKPVEKQKKM